jgi:hypothetical protein
MAKQKLTKKRILIAFAVAVIADLLEFPIAGAEVTILGAPGGELGACVVDTIVFGIMTKLLGFHWMFLPSFCVEVIPGLDMLPTWIGCIAFVVWQRKDELAQRPLLPDADVPNVELVDAPPAPNRTLPPPQTHG